MSSVRPKTGYMNLTHLRSAKPLLLLSKVLYPEPARTGRGTDTGLSESTATLEIVPYRSNKDRQPETTGTICLSETRHMETGNKHNKSLECKGEQTGKQTGIGYSSQGESNREEIELATQRGEKDEILVVPPYPILEEPNDELQDIVLEAPNPFETSHTEPAEYGHLPIQADMPNVVQSQPVIHASVRSFTMSSRSPRLQA